MLLIKKVDVNGHTGHLSVTACVVEEIGPGQVMHGCPETHGIDSLSIETLYGGDVDAWRKSWHTDMLARHDARKKAFSGLKSLEGKIVKLEE